MQRAGRFANLLQLDPDRWREQLLEVVLRVALVMGTIVCVPSVYMAVDAGIYGLAVADVVALGLLYLIRFAKGLPFRVRALAFAGVFYGIGTALVFTVGAIAQVYLLGFSLTATFLLGHRIGFASAVLSTLTLLGAGIVDVIGADYFLSDFPGDPSDLPSWVVITLNFALIDLALISITSSVLATVVARFQREQRARVSLQRSEALLSMALRVGRVGAWTAELPELHLRWAQISRGRETFDGSQLTTVAAALASCLPADRAALASAFERCLTDGTSFDLEVRLDSPTATGSRRGPESWLRWMGEARRDHDGVVVGARGAVQDVTEQRERERRVAEQAELLDKAQDAIVVLDLEGRATYLNRRAIERYRLDGNGQDLRAHLAASVDEYDEAFRSARHGTHTSEHQITPEGAEPIVVERRWTLLTRESGEAYGVMLIDTDVTEKRRLQEQLIRSQRLESIGTLASGIAHDLNNVITPILMAADMLRLGETDRERLSDLATIEGSARRASDMVKQILGFARGYQGQRALVEVRPLLSDLERMMRETFPKSIDVRVICAPDLHVIGDATQVTQVLVNLCVNARDAMPRGGTLSVAVEPVDLDDELRHHAPDASHAFVRFRVRDTGGGMAPETLHRIYEPFFTTKEVGKGTGLGLFTSHAIVKAHQGFIVVDSALDVGTTFEVYLPLASTLTSVGRRPEARMTRGRGEFVDEPSGSSVRGEGAASGVALRASTGGPGPYQACEAGECVLVVDDEDALRQMAQRMLELHGYEVLTASDGAEGLEMWSRHAARIRLVLTDMNMPVMDGAELVAALRGASAPPKIIAMSGLTIAPELPVDATLPKPFKSATLLGLVRQVLDAS